MRKFWVITSIGLAILLVGVLGVWVGAVYHGSLAAALGHRGEPYSMQPAQMASTASKTLYHCGMHPQIIQDHPGTCPICHMQLTPMQGGDAAEGGKAEAKILYYWDPMLGPSSISKTPGKSAMGMDMIPVYSDEASGGPTVTVDPAVVQNMGVQTAKVTKGSLNKTVRTVGVLEVPETGLYDITIKVNGYIDKLYADKTGMHIHKGDPLFDLYSPDLTVAEEELIAARKAVDAMSSAAPEVLKQAKDLMAGARRKLQLWDIPDADIDAIAKLEHAQKDITIHSPAEGHLEDKMIVQGTAVQAGMKLMRIEDHKTMWLEAKVYEGQLSLVQLGQIADATLDAMPGEAFSGKIIFINPHLDHMNRTTSVRIELSNSEFALKPGMYASVQIRTTPVEDVMLVPGSAIIDTGTRQLVFVQEDKGHFSPRLVTTGLSGDNDQVQVLSGVGPGEMVVTSGQFLMDVESRTLEAAQKFLNSNSTPTSTTGSTTAPATMPEMITTMSASTGESDDVVKAYLAVATYLGQDHADNKPANLSALVQSSGDFVQQVAMPENGPLAQAVKDAASLMTTESLEVQHKSFEKVGAAMLALIEKDPPSVKVAATLYVVNCPMEKADWLQTSPAVNNPFLPAMRTCGSVTKTLKLSPSK